MSQYTMLYKDGKRARDYSQLSAVFVVGHLSSHSQRTLLVYKSFGNTLCTCGYDNAGWTVVLKQCAVN